MPVEKIYKEPDQAWGLWRIEESEIELAAEVYPLEVVPESVTNPIKRLEFLAGRVLLKRLLREWKEPFKGLIKDEFGKPFFNESTIQLSLSHSYPYIAAIIHRKQNVGIDLEQPKGKLLRIASRVLSAAELADAGNDIVKHCVYWCAKETLIKIHGKKDLTLAHHLAIEPFGLAQKGDLIGRIIVDNHETAIPLQYIIEESFVVVVNQ